MRLILQHNQIKNFSVAQILRGKWEEYSKTHELRDVERQEVEKTLKCRSGENGVFVYKCKKCDETVYQLLEKYNISAHVKRGFLKGKCNVPSGRNEFKAPATKFFMGRTLFFPYLLLL